MVHTREIITVADLLEAQPVLAKIVTNAKKQAESGCIVWAVYEKAKQEAHFCVGWGCDTEELSSTVAYDLFIQYLRDELEV